MIAQNPLGDRFDVPDFNPDRMRSRWSSSEAYLQAFEALESAPPQPKLDGEDEAYSRSMRARKEADAAHFEICVWAKVRSFGSQHSLPETVETIDRMCDWQNFSWSERFNAFSHERDLCSLTDPAKCLVSEGYRPISASLDDAIARAGVAYREEFNASVATIPFEVAHSGDRSVEADNTLIAQRSFNNRLDQVALITKRIL